MTEINGLCEPYQVRRIYPEVVRAYCEAFANEPWFEVGKCAADLNAKQKCIGGLSQLAVGRTCGVCRNQIERPAYEYDELVGRFDNLAATRPVSWYVERDSDAGVTMAAIAWTAPIEQIADEKYADVPKMRPWLNGNLEPASFAWLDEVFANRALKSTGNLSNFTAMCEGMAERLKVGQLAFRTINPKMIRAAQKAFEDGAKVWRAEIDVPDRRDFVVMSIGGEYDQIKETYNGSWPTDPGVRSSVVGDPLARLTAGTRS